MAFITVDRKDEQRLQAIPVSAMAVFEECGLRKLIDSKFKADPRNKLTPGNSVKAMIGCMLSAEGRRPLFGIGDFYAKAPCESLFGCSADALGPRAFSRNLDRLFGIDLPELTNECYSKLAEFYNLDSKLFSVDMTNFSVTSLEKLPDLPGAAIPERCGHAKDGHNERLVYSLLTITDENGIVFYEKPYDGAASDGEMDAGAIEYLSGKVDPKGSTLIADCKIVTAPLISSVLRKGFGFVSKCPANFGNRIQERIVYSVKNGLTDPSAVRDGWELYDTDAEVEIGGTKTQLRFVAYRTTDDIRAGIEYLKEQGRKETEALISPFRTRRFNCEIDAGRYAEEAIAENHDSAYDISYEIIPAEVSAGYGRRGRPRKDERPVTRIEYAVDMSMKFNEERAKSMSQDRGVRVLITNLPRACSDADNVRFGATADTVLLSYLGQYRIEHAFRMMKDGMGIDRVYLHRPSRENAMMFVISLATMLSDTMTHVLRSNGMDLTAGRSADIMSSLMAVRSERTGDVWLDGIDEHRDMFMKVIGSLRIDPDNLF